MEDDDNTHNEFTKDSGVRVDGDDVKQEFDFILFDLAEVICTDEETCVERCEEVLFVIYTRLEDMV